MYEKYKSFFADPNTGEAYHLHPHLVTKTVGQDGVATFETMICERCRQSLSGENAKIPKLSIAAGLDFGKFHEIMKLPKLSLLETILISLDIPFGFLVKLKSIGRAHQNALKGHVIAFSHDGAAKAAILSEELENDRVQLPHTHRDVLEYVKAAFVGPLGSKDCLKALALPEGPLRCNLTYMMEWLKVLVVLNPEYKDRVKIIDNTEDNDKFFAELPTRILDAAQLATGDVEQVMEEVIGADYANVRSANAGDKVDHVEGFDSQQADSDDEESETVDMNSPDWERNLCLVLDRTLIVSGDQADKSAGQAAVTQLYEMMSVNPDTNERQSTSNDEPTPVNTTKPSAATGKTPVIVSTREKRPRDEFHDNDRILASCFPTLFLFGTAGPRPTSGSFSTELTTYLMLHHTCRFAQDPRLLFYLFNQTQRHGVTRATNLRIRARSEAVERFVALTNAKDFKDRLHECHKNPESTDAKKLAKELEPLLAKAGKSVPYSPAARRAAFAHSMGCMQRFGSGLVFLTMAFNDKDNALAIRLAHPSRSNKGFPAQDSGLRQCREDGASEFVEADDGDGPGHTVVLPIKDERLLSLMANNPVAATFFFKLLFEAIMKALLGVSFDKKLTVPINDTSRMGVMGVITDINANLEANGRGYLHFHAILCSVLSPALMSGLAHSPVFMDVISQIFDKMLSAELPFRCNVEASTRSLFRMPRPPKRWSAVPPQNPNSATAEYERHVAECASRTCVHNMSHDPTCIKRGVPKCRLAKPSGAVNATGAAMLVTCMVAEGDSTKLVITAERVPEPERPGENLADCPITPLDSRPLTFELRRRKLPMPSSDEDPSLLDWLDSAEMDDLDPDVREKLLSITAENRRCVLHTACQRNLWVSDFCPPLMAATACNQAAYVIGLGAGGKSAQMYIAKYIVKSQTAITSLLSLLYHAKQHVDEYPSQAADQGTELRNSIHLAQRFLNTINGTCEYSGCQAAGALLGLNAEQQMARDTHFFAHSFVKYARDELSQLARRTTSSDADSSSSYSEESFGSSGYDSSEVNNRRDLPPLDGRDFNDENEEEAHDGGLSPDEEFGDPSAHDPGLDPPPPDDPPTRHEPGSLSKQFEQLEERAAAVSSSVPVTVVNGKPLVVFQHMDYYYRSQLPPQSPMFSFHLMIPSCLS